MMKQPLPAVTTAVQLTAAPVAFPPISTGGPIPPTAPAANPMHVKQLAAALDLNPFVKQVEHLLSSPIRIPSTSLLPYPGASQTPMPKPFSVRGIWKNDQDRKAALSELYNFKTINRRVWLKNLLLEESDTDSDGEQPISEQDLKILLKIHRCRRKYQKKYHGDIMNSQYTYYGAGLLSETDKFPEHQAYVNDQFGYGMADVWASASTTQQPQSDLLDLGSDVSSRCSGGEPKPKRTRPT